MKKTDPWYIHAGLYLIIFILALVLIKVAIIDPKDAVERANFFKNESRLRMKNLKEAEILWQKKHGTFTASLDSLVTFVKTDPLVDSVMNAYDSLSHRPANPFVPLTSGKFTPDSLIYSPRSHQRYTLEVDSTVSADTVVNRAGKIVRIDSTLTMGNLYYIEDPDGYGSVGSTTDQALKNTSSWE
jgi:hypothetical protein